MEIKHVGVIGAGTMGNGIAHAFAARGFTVSLIDTTKEILDRAMFTIAKNMDRQVKKEIITADDKSAALANIATAIDMQTARSADLGRSGRGASAVSKQRNGGLDLGVSLRVGL